MEKPEELKIKCKVMLPVSHSSHTRNWLGPSRIILNGITSLLHCGNVLLEVMGFRELGLAVICMRLKFGRKVKNLQVIGCIW